MSEQMFLERLAKRLTEWSALGRPLVVAVSGGPDSVALLRGLAALSESKTTLVAAHLNHGLRRQSARRDEQFVSDLAGELGVHFVGARVELEAEARQRRESLETAARDCRYAFLRDTAQAVDAGFVAVGHTADDQVETILHRIVRGTGLSGLAGIPARRKLGAESDLIRPLLDFRRCEVLDYLKAIDQPYCWDETNDDLSYTRNRLRNELLPTLEQAYNPRVREALLRLGQLAGEAQAVVDHQVLHLLGHAEAQGDGLVCSLRIAPFSDCPPYVVRAALIRFWQDAGWGLRDMGFEEWDRLADLILNQAKPFTLPGNIDVRRRGDRVEFRRSVDRNRQPADASSLCSA